MEKGSTKMEKFKNIARVKRRFSISFGVCSEKYEGRKNTVISGFKAAGLYPFDSSAVDYDVFNKRKKSKTPVTEEKIQDKLSEDEQKRLLSFENNLSKDILEAFNNARLNQTWPEDSEMRGLYKYWLQISGKPGSLDTTSVITNITNVPTTTLTTPVMEKNSEPQINLTLSESVVSKENAPNPLMKVFHNMALYAKSTKYELVLSFLSCIKKIQLIDNPTFDSGYGFGLGRFPIPLLILVPI
ncbi:hypothetical protein EVAR_18694_1 [Eumeta japonica]|uniref:Uncharacterized protein n=1 Tax=Eumeta variegata TaxID=151549 RepID=A0A4C1U6P2_EUMVA|nr:hypothetical protein EVAR_18694_1 [Eumeta japonica]